MLKQLKKNPFVIVPFLFYGATCSRTVGSGAPAMHIDTIMKRVVSTHVDCHNLTMVTGWLFSHLPFGELAFRLNLVSSFYGALAVVAFYFTLLEIFGASQRKWAAVGSLLLMVSHSLWWHSTILESYAANAFLTSLAALFLARLAARDRDRDRDLFGLCLIAGAALFNHVEMGFLCVAALVAAVARMIERPVRAKKIFWGCAIAAVIGLAPWTVLFFRDWVSMGTFRAEVRHAFFGPFSGLMLSGPWDGNLKDFVLILFTDHPTPFILCVFPGIWVLVKKWKPLSPSSLGFLTHLTLTSLFAFSYRTWNKFSFAEPALLWLSLSGVVGLEALWGRLNEFIPPRRIRLARLAVAWLIALSLTYPPVFYSQLSAMGENPGSMWNLRYSNSHSPNAYRVNEYIANPNKMFFREYQSFAEALFSKLPRNSMFFDDDGRSYYQLADYYQKYLGERRDLAIHLMNSFGYDQIGWGHDPQSTAALIQKAYFYDQDLFTISLAYPFSRSLESMPASERFQFERYDLPDGHWVYRLLTKKDEKRLLLQFRTQDPDLYRPLQVAGASVEYDLSEKNVLFAKQLSVEMQNMKEYGNFWKNQNQVFMRGEGEGAWAEVLVDSDRYQKVSLDFNFTTSYDYAKADVWLNDQPILSDRDFYSKDVFHRLESAKNVKLLRGINRLIFKILGRSQDSYGYNLGVDFVRITPIVKN